MKHLPFHSIYRENFEVVEERQGHVRLFPHTAQLPIIHRALNLEFLGPLPGKLSRLDHRASDFDRIVRKMAALLFTTGFNGSRTDEVRLMPLPDPNRIAQVAVVQHVRKDTRLGLCHRFRFYAGPGFCPEILLNGKRLVFSDHALERFSTRVTHPIGGDVTDFLLTFYGTQHLSLPIPGGRAFFSSMAPSFLAFPYKESATEFFITTCLTIDQLHSFEVELPPPAYNLHYGKEFTRPTIRHWYPTNVLKAMHTSWERKIPVSGLESLAAKNRWSRLAQVIPEVTRHKGHGPASRLLFLDHIPGPCTLEIRPTESEPRCDELQSYKDWKPDQDWEAIFAENLSPPDHYDRIKS